MRAILLGGLLLVLGCKDDLCPGLDCRFGKVCEEVVGGSPEGGDHECFQPLVIVGRVFDLDTGAGIAAARVYALDLDGAPGSTVGSSGADGAYLLQVPTPRDSYGGPWESRSYTLHAEAAGYQPFEAVEVDTFYVVEQLDGRYVLDSELTDLGLDGR